MNAKLTRIHLGFGMGEIGVQFEIDDGAGGFVTQRAFVEVEDEALAPVWLAAQGALAAKLGALPLEMPPGNVTSALMRQRTAEAAARQAEKDKADAEAKRYEAEERRKKVDEESVY